MSRPPVAAALVATAAALSVATAPAHAAGRCGDVAQRPWCDTRLSPDARAALLLGALTQDEKVSLLAGDELTGVLGREGTHTGTSNGVDRVGLPPIYFSDGPVGTRQGQATGMPSPMSVAASFDPQNAYRHAAIVGDEVRKKGNDVVFAPAMNMLRTPLNGRTFEYFGEDPFLSGRIAVGWTKGVQSTGVIADAKHFAVNNQEGQAPPVDLPPAGPLGAGVEGNRLAVDARLDERTLREIYLPHFEAVVKEGGVGSIMCAYPRVNGTFACENSHLLEDVLKGDWNFKGFVLTDYGAAKNTINSLNNGLDLDIWPAVVYQPPLVNAALAAGQVSQSAVDEHIRRQLRTLFAFGFFDRDAFVDDVTKIDQAAHDAAAADIEAQGIVLLRNQGGLLPLNADALRRVALIGPEANTIKDGGGSSAINEFKLTPPKAALEAALGADRVTYADGSDLGAATAAAKAADVAVVVVGDRMTEGGDKPCMGLNCGQTDGVDRDALIEAVAAANPRTVVVLQSGGPTLTPWRTKVPALLEAWFPGQNGGTAIARVLLGEAEPQGRLPGTFPVAEADEPVAGDPEKYPGVGLTVRYKEGVLIGYRWFDREKKDVAFPFGFGLSYTSFAFSGLRLQPSGDASRVVVSAVMRNTGTRAGHAVPQLYVGMPEPDAATVQPPWQLKGFDKVALAPGESKRVTFSLDDRAFSYWGGGWRIAPGCYRIGVGASSRDLPLVGVVGRGAECEGALQLPAGRKACTSKRTFVIHLPRVMRRATVTVGGRRVATRRRGGRLTARVDLRRFARTRVTVEVRGRTRGGKARRQTRVYRTCTRR